jgi:branched-chain amino acid transport system ATP-binding protein
MHSDVALRVYDLRVSYGLVPAIEGASFHIGPAQIVTIIGPNGAGKTTLLNAIAGLIPAKGLVQLGSEDVSKVAPHERVCKGLSIVPEQRDLFGSMSVEDNLKLGAWAVRGRSESGAYSIGDVYKLFPRLNERRRQLAATLSGGERQMLALGRALMSNPSILLLDEPSQGLAPKIVIEIFRTIGRLSQLGVAVLVVEQNARIALQYATYGYVLENGSITLEGKASVLREDERVIDSYLGRGALN